MKLSILILTLPSRMDSFFPRLIRDLEDQIDGREDIEILALLDNKTRTVGEKRNDLINLAKGEYLTFIDDDDRIAETYIDDIMAVLDEKNTDCVVFESICTVNGMNPKHCTYGIEYDYVDSGATWTGKPAHTMVWRSEIAKNHTYIDKNYGEDIDWVKRACLDIKKQERINKVLYYYDMNYHTSETRG